MSGTADDVGGHAVRLAAAARGPEAGAVSQIPVSPSGPPAQPRGTGEVPR